MVELFYLFFLGAMLLFVVWVGLSRWRGEALLIIFDDCHCKYSNVRSIFGQSNLNCAMKYLLFFRIFLYQFFSNMLMFVMVILSMSDCFPIF